jgi:phosphatidylinositol glycan class V
VSILLCSCITGESNCFRLLSKLPAKFFCLFVGTSAYFAIGQLLRIALAIAWLSAYYSVDLQSTIKNTLMPWKRFGTRDMMMAHSHFAAVTLLLLVFNSHVQIALRFASPGGIPAIWWGASHLLLHYKNKRLSWLFNVYLADAIVAYLVTWNVISVILYAGFYPPA